MWLCTPEANIDQVYIQAHAYVCAYQTEYLHVGIDAAILGEEGNQRNVSPESGLVKRSPARSGLHLASRTISISIQ